MPLSKEEKKLFLMHQDKPLVGLIHKETKEIVLAPCITPKVCLNFNPDGKAISGTYMEDQNDIQMEELEKFNDLIQKGYVPRLAYISEFIEKSAHEFLFEQKCSSTRKSEWGGFAVQVNSSGSLEYQFVSGAFNSPKGKRVKGALLSEDLISEVLRQFNEYMPSASVPVTPVSAQEPIRFESPPRKRLCSVTPSKMGFFAGISAGIPPRETSSHSPSR
ncbi:MAG TPA: hypothetical protein DCZ80_00740 [Legionellales bacterium]|nr:hypothetical protein [Legionellales bacterium]